MTYQLNIREFPAGSDITPGLIRSSFGLHREPKLVGNKKLPDQSVSLFSGPKGEAIVVRNWLSQTTVYRVMHCRAIEFARVNKIKSA